MAEFARILAALLSMYFPWGWPLPVITPTPRPVAKTATRTATLTRTPTRTSTPQPTPTLTPRPIATLPVVPSNPLAVAVTGAPPAQKLPSAFLIYPLIRTSATQETLVEIMNLTAATVTVHCTYTRATFSGQTVSCNETDFYVNLTAQQPVAWKARTGSNGNGARVAPPFLGEGTLNCVVQARGSDLNSHNALQGRAILSQSGQTVGYDASAFRRLSAGPFSGVIELDGVHYEQCPDRLHFNALSSQPGSDSEMVLVPCSHDFENGHPGSSVIQYAVINEFEQQFSASTPVKCFDRRNFSTISALRKSSTGTDTLHVVVRPVGDPVVGLVLDKFAVPGSGALSVSSNNPYFEGGRSATVTLPQF